MKSALLRAVRQMILPNGVLILAGIMLSHWGVGLAPRTAQLFALGVCAMGALLAWRFHSPRPMLALVLLALTEAALMILPAASGTSANSAGFALLLAPLLPLNFAVFLLVDDASFDLEAFGWWSAVLLIQSCVVLGLWWANETAVLDWLGHRLWQSGGGLAIPHIPLLLFAFVGTGLLVKALFCRTAVDIGLFWSLTACFLAMNATNEGLTSAFVAVAGLILGIAVVEASYQVAYNDELTGLPGRRAFRRALGLLDHHYAIAILDIDHFKHFNDTYGHEIGDQVLRRVAGDLARVTGGGKAYRCGGEEFAILFPNLSAGDARDHAELLRLTIAESPFVVRGPDRSHRPRKERRRTQSKRTLRVASTTASITVSIGIAERGAAAPGVDDVVRAADQALYQAKENGRNRVELYRRAGQKSGVKVVSATQNAHR